jgi:hypothetical protein
MRIGRRSADIVLQTLEKIDGKGIKFEKSISEINWINLVDYYQLKSGG